MNVATVVMRIRRVAACMSLARAQSTWIRAKVIQQLQSANESEANELARRIERRANCGVVVTVPLILLAVLTARTGDLVGATVFVFGAWLSLAWAGSWHLISSGEAGDGR